MAAHPLAEVGHKGQRILQKTTHSYDLQFLFYGSREDMYAEKTFLPAHEGMH